jgi:hypothetical protein
MKDAVAPISARAEKFFEFHIKRLVCGVFVDTEKYFLLSELEKEA